MSEKEIGRRIFQARSDARMTQEELAKAVGKTRSAVAQWESGDVRPRHNTLIEIAAVTEKPLGWLLGETDLQENSVGLKLVGEVAAGTWKEGTVYVQQVMLPVARHPDYPAHAQRMYKVSGKSINRLADDGEYLQAVDIQEASLTPEEGDLVIVRRMQHGLAEYTAKTLAFVNGIWVLRPESYEPEWQDDIPLEGDESTEIQITDIVIAKWKPIPRKRPIKKNGPDPFRI